MYLLDGANSLTEFITNLIRNVILRGQSMCFLVKSILIREPQENELFHQVQEDSLKWGWNLMAAHQLLMKIMGLG